MTRWLLDLLNRHWHRDRHPEPDLSRPDERFRHAWDDEDWPRGRAE